jgi:FlaG/FlaF family flagellin (archaellin)
MRFSGMIGKKGVSPLVAATLLIVMVVAIATIMMGWLYSFTRGAQETVTNRTDEAVSCSGASMEVQDVYLANGSAGTARAITKNTGFVDMIINSAQIFNRTGHNFTGSDIPIANFTRGKIITIVFSNISMPTCSDFSQVVVATNCGDISASFKKTPKGC